MNYRCALDNCESDECECEDCDCDEYTQDECCDYFDSLDDIDDFCNCTGDYECESEDDFDEYLKELDMKPIRMPLKKHLLNYAVKFLLLKSPLQTKRPKSPH